MPDRLEKFITDYLRARPWMLEEDGSFKVSGASLIDLEEDYEIESKTVAEYIENGKLWLDVAEWEVLENESPDSASPMAMLSMASALLGICATLSQDSKTD